MGKKIDKYGLRFLILLVWWILISQTGAVTAARVIASFAAAMCTVGLTERLWIKEEKKAEEKKREPLRPKLKKLAAAAMTRKNARRFMTVALILLAFSFFVPVPVWFYVMIVINVALTVACFAAGDRNVG